MARCIKIRTKKRRICIGDLNKEITLENRDITPPLFNAVDFNEEFVPLPIVWAGIETTTGKTFFDGINTDTPITHIIYIRYDVLVTAETWINYDGRRIDILAVEDFDERKEFMKLTCVDRGLISKEASKS